MPYIPLRQLDPNKRAGLLDARVTALERGYRPDLSRTVFYTASGTFLKGDFPGLRGVKIYVQGGGGGGGGADTTAAGQAAMGGGGGGGGYAERFIPVDSLAISETVTVGSGGSGGSGASGSAGGASSFGSFVTANGGNAGNLTGANTTAVDQTGATGGTATGGDINIQGGYASPLQRLSAGQLATGVAYVVGSSQGGVSFLGAGGRGAQNANGLTGVGYGGGGGGASNLQSQSDPRVGGTGASGIVIVELYF